MESEAQEAMRDIAKENALLARRAQEKLVERLTAIESDGAAAIRQLINEAETHATAEIERVQEEYREKSDAFEEKFHAGKEKLRGKIFHDVVRC